MFLFLEKLLTKVLFIFSFIFSFNIYKFFKKAHNIFFSFIVKRRFHRCGRRFHVEYPLILFGEKHISIGDDFTCFARLRLEAYYKLYNQKFDPVITIGNNVGMNFDCHIACINKVTIGNNVLMASRIFITDHYHGQINAEALKLPPANRPLHSPGPVIIEDNVWIGENVTIMPNVVIGKNSIIGANSVVTKSLAANCVAVGMPARVIKVL